MRTLHEYRRQRTAQRSLRQLIQLGPGAARNISVSKKGPKPRAMIPYVGMPGPAFPQVTLHQFETEYADRHLLHAAVDHWAAHNPTGAAVLNATRGTSLTWAELQRGSMALAAELARMGFRKGDVLAASLPLLNEHILLEYACFRLGVIHAPLDLRLQPPEVLRCLTLIRAKGYAFLGKTPAADFAALGEAVRARRCH